MYPCLSGSLARMMPPRLPATLSHADEVAYAPQDLPRWHTGPFQAEEIKGFGTDEGIGDERGNLFRREGAQGSADRFGLANQRQNEIDPTLETGAHDLGDNGIGPTRGDKLLQHAHVSRCDIIIEIVAGLVPLFREFAGRIAEQSVLTIEQLCI